MPSKQSLHFAFVLFRYFPFGGLQKDFLRTLEEALKRGHKVTVWAACWEGDVPEMEGLTLRILPAAGCSNHGRMRSFARSVLRELEAGDFDCSLMFSRLPGGDFYFAADNCLAVDWAKVHAPWILRCLPRYRAFLALERAVFGEKSSTRIFTIAPQQIRDYQAVYHTPGERIIPVPAGIDPDCKRPENAAEIRRRIRERFQIPEDAVLLVQVAAQFEVKGVDRSIRAMAEQKNPALYLLIAGGGDIAKYQAIAGKYQVADRVIFAGACKDVPQLLAASDLMIHPARKESAGNVIVEALAAGVPVLTSAACGFAFYAATVHESLVVPEPFSQKELDRALQDALVHWRDWTIKVQSPDFPRDFYRRAEVIVDHLEEFAS